MERSTKYVGFDVHQASTVSSVRVEGGRVIARTVVPTEASAMVELFRCMCGSAHVVFEEGTQAQWLHDLIAALVAQVQGASPLAHVIVRRARDTRQLALANDAEPGMLRIDHPCPPVMAQGPKAFDKHSFSTVSWPILAYSDFTSASRSVAPRAAFLRHTGAPCSLLWPRRPCAQRISVYSEVE